MIRTEQEYKEASSRLLAEKDRLSGHEEHFKSEGFTGERLERLIAPLWSFHQQLEEEINAYEQIRRGSFTAIKNLHGIGQLLIGARIYRGISQRELADQLGVHESQVSRDERNEYHGISVDRAGRIFEALDFSLDSELTVASGK